MPRKIESLFLSGQAGKLEALLEEPDGEPVEAAVVCHPHPQFGGTLHNKVVYRIARGLRKTGCVVLRFNYRGVNLSEGAYDEEIGETEDARVAFRELQTRYPGLPLIAAGFSFGARVSFRLASTEPKIRRVLAAGFPTRLQDREFAYQIQAPKYFIQSTQDSFGPRAELESFYHTLAEPKQLDWITADDHFFTNALPKFEEAIQKIGLQRELAHV